MIHKTKILMLTTILITDSIWTNKSLAAESSPYDNIRYSTAFDQETIYQQYKHLMLEQGCYENVFPNQEKPTSIPSSTNNSNYDLKAYHKACMTQLNHARFMSLAEPGMYAIAEMILIAGSAGLTMACLGSESMGGSFAGFSAIFNSMSMLLGVFKSGYHIACRPDNPLGVLEEYFAKNKCYIPRVLWPKIIQAFISARQDTYSREIHINFLNFTLGLTTYKPKPKLTFKDNSSIELIKCELNQRIDSFFSDYKHEENFQSLNHIKINLSKFLDSLVNKNNPPARYVYLHGAGGIGKTHFVQILAEWIEELIPQSVYFENLIINAPEELEGTSQKPGALLKVLRNQLMLNKTGSVIIIDEATWLNEYGMISPAKRTFNGQRSKISTAYFGSEIDGSAISLDMPPMLIFVASNEQIKDNALKSRFDIIHYPTPTTDTLIKYALAKAQSSIILQETNCNFNEAMIINWIENLDPQHLNFRYIDGNVEAYILDKKGQTIIYTACMLQNNLEKDKTNSA